MADIQPPPIVLADLTPMPERTAPQPGDQPYASRMDHVHPRLTSVTGHKLDSTGRATVVFTQAFAPAAGVNPYPGMSCIPTDTSGATPIIAWKVESWATDANGNYTGCVIRAYRGQTLPVQPQVTGITLLTQVVTALNSVITAFSGYDVTGGSAAGADFTCIAVKRSTATS